MFRVKICGITVPADADHAVECGADAIGINFFRGSPRFVTEEEAGAIVDTVAGRADVVAVFVDAPPEDIVSRCKRLGIRHVQLHGHETPGDASRIPFWRMKAIHALREATDPSILAYPCEAFLLDAGGVDAFGGTGRQLPWGDLARRFPGIADRHPPGENRRPWILAGGLDPENVVRAIVAARPFGVDVSTGVESSPGRKDPRKVERFIERAKEGFYIAGS